MKNIFYFTIVYAFVACGCAPQKFFSNELNNGNQESSFEKVRAACEVPEIDYQFETQVVEFDVTSKNEFHFGFSLIPGLEWFNAFDAQFKLKSSTLTLSTSMAEYLKPMDPIGQATGDGKQKENFWGVDIDLSKIKFGGSSFISTPMFKVMTAALRNSVQNTVKILKDVESPWNTVVVSIPNQDQFLIPAGKNAGIQVGDQFEIFNIQHEWAGAPCRSAYRMALPTTEKPIAIVEVKDARDLTPNAARLRIVKKELDEKIEQGAYVYIHKLTNPRTLRRSIFVQDIKPFKISWKSDGSSELQELDVTPFLNTALGPVLRDFGLYIKPKIPAELLMN